MKAIDLFGFGMRLTNLMDNPISGERISALKLQEMTHINREKIGRFRTGDIYPTLDEVQSIADALSIPVEYLLGLGGIQSIDLEHRTSGYWLGFLEGALRRRRGDIGEDIDLVYWASLIGQDAEGLREIDHNWERIKSFLGDLDGNNNSEAYVHTAALLSHYLTNRIRHEERLEIASTAYKHAKSLEEKCQDDPEHGIIWRITKLIFLVDGVSWTYLELGNPNEASRQLHKCLYEINEIEQVHRRVPAYRFQHKSIRRLKAITKIFLARAKWEIQHGPKYGKPNKFDVPQVLTEIDENTLQNDAIVRGRYCTVLAEIAITNGQPLRALELLNQAQSAQIEAHEGFFGTQVTRALVYLKLASQVEDPIPQIMNAQQCLTEISHSSPPIDYRWAEFANLRIERHMLADKKLLMQRAKLLREKLMSGGYDITLKARVGQTTKHNLLRDIECLIKELSTEDDAK